MTHRDEVALEVLDVTVGRDGRPVRSLRKRFSTKYEVDPVSGCWLWTAAVRPDGYGAIQMGATRGTILAHRLSYLMSSGVIPDEPELDHLCRVRRCVNPSHLEPVSTRENGIRGVPFRESPTQCPKGHEYALHGKRFPSGEGTICKLCAADAQRRRRATLPRKVRVKPLTADAVREMRAAHAAGRSLRSLAEEHGTSYTTAWQAVNRRTYKDVQ